MKRLYLYIAGFVAIVLAAIAAWLAVSGIKKKEPSEDITGLKNAKAKARAKDSTEQALTDIAAIDNSIDRANAYRAFIKSTIKAAQQ